MVEARRLWRTVDRPNLMIKVPATAEGIPAVERLIGEGINVNATLMFSLADYEAVAHAYLRGLEACAEPAVLTILSQAGVRHFDCASLAEIEAVSAACEGASCYFMVPVRTRGEARIAEQEFGVRHFLIDHSTIQPTHFAGEFLLQAH